MALDDWSEVKCNPAMMQAMRELCVTDFKAYVKLVFKHVYKKQFRWSAHHSEVTKWLMCVWLGRKRNIIINIPPRYSKTELLCLFASWAFAHNPACEFLHLSYSATLAEKNSDKIRQLIKSDFYASLFGVSIDARKDSASEWHTDDGGVFYATATGGQVTGFGAGSINEVKNGEYTFSGMIWIDDPLKPDDAHTVRRGQINDRWDGTIKSRRNNPQTTPTVCIMQRLHEGDFTAELLADTAEAFEVLKMPALRDDGTALWPFMHTAEQLKAMEERDLYTFSAQYQQNPTPAGGSIFKREWWRFYTALPAMFDQVIITADTAQKIQEHNDYSVLQAWGLFDGNIYLIDQTRGKWEAPQLKEVAVSFIDRINRAFKVRSIHIEDKSSGTGLIQSIKGTIPLIPIQRNKDKVTRSFDVAPYVQGGKVLLPEGAGFTESFLQEATSFSATMAHLHDDQIDPMMDAVDILLDKAPPKPAFGRGF